MTAPILHGDLGERGFIRAFGSIGRYETAPWFAPVELRGGFLLRDRIQLGVRVGGGRVASYNHDENDVVTLLTLRPESRYSFRPHAKLQPMVGASVGMSYIHADYEGYGAGSTALLAGADVMGGVQWGVTQRTSVDCSLAFAYQFIQQIAEDRWWNQSFSSAISVGMTVRV